MTELAFKIYNSDWLSANHRLHWAAAMKRVSRLRDMGYFKGRESGLHYTVPVRVIAHIGYATNGKADPANALAVKHLIDGLVDAGVFIDDDHTHLIGPDYRRDTTKAPRGYHTVRLVIEEVGV